MLQLICSFFFIFSPIKYESFKFLTEGGKIGFLQLCTKPRLLGAGDIIVFNWNRPCSAHQQKTQAPCVNATCELCHFESR